MISIIHASFAFNPLSIENHLINLLGTRFGETLERATNVTLSHEEILRRGLKKSLIKYLNDIHAQQFDVNDDKLSIREIYTIFYGQQCKVGVEQVMTNIFGPIIASVDLNTRTKDLPDAHFDSERLVESNKRVQTMTEQILALLLRTNPSDFTIARELTAKALHTIHDFYSHTNWIELGHTQINSRIGTDDFEFSNPSNETSLCLDNCEEIKLNCTQLVSPALLGGLKCPLVYWKCKNNVNTTQNFLFSGFYSNQKLEDGTLAVKPENVGKCSHGGIFDSTSSTIQSLGGINKDSGYYLLSPKAHLHLVAANLAIDHTEYYFNFLREQIGDKKFSKFLRIDPNDDLLNKLCSLFKFFGK